MALSRIARAVARPLPAAATIVPTIVASRATTVAVAAPVRAIHASRAALSGAGIAQHRMTTENNLSTPFDFTPANKEKIKTILARYPPQYKQSGIMPLLQLAQEQNDNWLPLTAMNKVAEILDVAPIRVYEVATFYSMYNRTPMGKYHIQLCGTTPCQLCGAEKIGAAMLRHLGVQMGETTPDGLFTVTEVECLGACVNAPMIQVNNHEFYENLTEENAVALLEGLKKGGIKSVKVGPQTKQKNCEGPMGKTSLFTEHAPVCRDLDALKASIAAAAAKPATPAAAAAPPPPQQPPQPAPPKPAAPQPPQQPQPQQPSQQQQQQRKPSGGAKPKK